MRYVCFLLRRMNGGRANADWNVINPTDVYKGLASGRQLRVARVAHADGLDVAEVQQRDATACAAAAGAGGEGAEEGAS